MRLAVSLFVLVLCYFYSNVKYGSSRIRNSENNFEKIFVFGIFFLLFFVQAIQETTGQNDVFVYKERYESYIGWSYELFFKEWNSMKDPVYNLIGFIFLRIGASFEFFKICINAFYIFSIYRLVSKYSAKPGLSIITFVVIGSYGFSFTGLRQTLALAVLMYSYKYLIEKSFIKFSLLVLLATTFHSSAIIFIIAYFAYHMKKSFFSLGVLSVFGLIAVINSKALVSLYLNLFDAVDAYGAYLEKEEGLTITGFLIYFSILIFTLFFVYNNKWNARDPKLTHLLLISVVFRILSVVWFAEFFRISMYFSVFDVLLIADACETNIGEKPFLPRFKTFVVSSILCLYYLKYT